MTSPHAELILDTLERVHDALARHGIWHSLAYGTLLGALRDGDIIPWDHDFDLLVRPVDVDAIHALDGELSSHGITLRDTRHQGEKHLALNRRRIRSFHTSATGVFRQGQKLGDLYAFSLFSDGVLRRYDFETEAYWCPHSSFPHYFIEGEGTAMVRGREYPTVGQAEQWLEGTYGADWSEPYRAVLQGGERREGTTVHGDRYEPKLAAEIEWCIERGWDREKYRCEPTWPRSVEGAGPRGPTPRTVHTSGALWWKDRSELLAHF